MLIAKLTVFCLRISDAIVQPKSFKAIVLSREEAFLKKGGFAINKLTPYEHWCHATS